MTEALQISAVTAAASVVPITPATSDEELDQAARAIAAELGVHRFHPHGVLAERRQELRSAVAAQVAQALIDVLARPHSDAELDLITTVAEATMRHRLPGLREELSRMRKHALESPEAPLDLRRVRFTPVDTGAWITWIPDDAVMDLDHAASAKFAVTEASTDDDLETELSRALSREPEPLRAWARQTLRRHRDRLQEL